MAPAADRLAALSESQRQELESLLLDFELTWTAEAFAGCVDKLASEDQDYRQVALLELVRIDLERQWQAGNRRSVEDYLQRFPELGTTENVASELLLAEYQARQLSGEPAELHDFGRRFPQHIERLQQLLQQSIATASSQVSRRAHTNTSRADEKVETQAEPTAKSWSLPMEFGRYRILKTLGEGGMGSVYLAHDTELDRQVAIKMPKFAGGEDPQLIERFYREARAAAKLQNRHICQVYDVGEIDGVRYISMAYIEGHPLSVYTRSARNQPERSVVLVVRRLSLALQEAHAQGVVHRDLKPANIMIDGKREPVIMDFGLARQLDKYEDSRLTKSGMILGTPAYMSPEQVSSEIGDVGPSSDIYSLGVILYELLTGRVPFEGSMAAVLGQIMTQRPPRPSELRADLDPRLEQICLKMMAKRVEDRYASMQEVADALVDFLKGPVEVGLDEAASPDENQQLEEMFATQYAYQSADPLARTERDATPHPTPSAWSRYRCPPVAAGMAAGAVALILFGVFILLRTPHGTLRIEVDDPQLIVSLDGDDLTIEELKEPRDLHAGTHRLAVKLGETTLPLGDKVRLKTTEHNGEYQLAVTFDGVAAVSESFTIVKGDQRVLTIGLEKPALPEPVGHAAPTGQQVSGVVAQGQMVVASAQTLNPDLAVTSFLLGIGGSVGVLVGESSPEGNAAKIVQVTPHASVWDPSHYRQITAHADVPQEPFTIHTVIYPAGTAIDDLSHLAGLQELHTIVMKGTQPSERAFTTLPRPNTVKVLVLHDAKIDAADLLGLSGWSQLEKLDLNQTLLRGRRIQDADLAVLTALPELWFLCLPTAEITDAGVDTLVQCSKLRWLHVGHGSKITDAGFGKLRTLKLLTGLYVANQITDAGLAYLSDFPELTDVGIRSSRVTNAGMLNIASLVERLHNLEIPGTTISDDGLLVLENATKLTYLALGPDVTDRGLAYLSNCPLKHLNLDACAITDAGLRQLEKMTTLEKLILGPHAKVSESALQVFRTKLPGCEIEMAQRTATLPRQESQNPNAPWSAILPTDAPSPAIAPFDAATAKQHQQAWAKHLSVPVERDVDLGDGVKLTLVLIPPGEFLMGSTAAEQASVLEQMKASKNTWSNDLISSEGPQHRVRITKPFWLSRHEVTRGQFRRFVEETGHTTEFSKQRGVKGGRGFVNGKWVQDPRFDWSADQRFPQTDDHPVVNVSWNDATAFCQWLSKQQGVKYDLPTEAQWEYACRAGTTTFWHCGDSNTTLREFAWFGGNASSRTHPVGQLRANGFGLHDMHGNVWEWCTDRLAKDYYTRGSLDDPSGPKQADRSRVLRGGSWISVPWRCGSARRYSRVRVDRDYDLGFRVVAVLADGETRAKDDVPAKLPSRRNDTAG